MTGLLAMTAFSLAERWPQRMPLRFPRWVWQLLATVLVIPPAAFLCYSLTSAGDPLWADPDRLESAAILAFMGLLFGPWVALAGMLSQREAFAREQTLALELARSELARVETEARWRLLQAQATPHFLFNTLATVQALVDARSPQAASLLSSLTDYLRAAVPHTMDGRSSIAQEVDMTRAYLDIMRTRMPDRLRCEVRVDPAALPLRCPSLVLLTLVENAIRHGIDPSEEGGSIDIDIALEGGRCRIRVANTVLTQARAAESSTPGLGTGLAALRERLRLSFGASASLMTERSASGFVARVEFAVA
jgi:LytS/YehU family sensor histidine kinase